MTYKRFVSLHTLNRMQKRQNYYNDNQFQSGEEEELYVTFCNEAMFRIHVLEQRLNAHKEVPPPLPHTHTHTYTTMSSVI